MLWWPGVVSLLSLVLSVVTFWLNRPAAELARRQAAQMNLLAARAIIFSNQLLPLTFALRRNMPPDERSKQQLCINAKRLEEALDAAIGIGLWAVVLRGGSAARGNNNFNYVFYYNKFASSLTDVIHKAETGTMESPYEWCNDDIWCGVARLIDAASQYRHLDETTKPLIKDWFPQITRETGQLDPRERAWAYLEREAGRVH